MDNSKCPLDVEYSEQIAALLAPPSYQSIQAYYDEVIRKTPSQCLEIECSGTHGKGVYAIKKFEEEEVILKDRFLVAVQHTSNKIDSFVCSYCFRYIGSIELQIGRKLYLNRIGLSSDCHCSNDTCIAEATTENGGAEIHDKMSLHSHNLSTNGGGITEDILSSLMNEEVKLPYSEKFSLPEIHHCLGGCKEEHYCSETCARLDWETCHSLLCMGERMEPSRMEAINKFTEHAMGTNDIFFLAAKVISYTILRYKKLKKAQLDKDNLPEGLAGDHQTYFPLLLEAWKPISMGFKQRWWDFISLPDDIDSSEEDSFRMDIKDMAFTSLQLLKDAIYEKECAPLFSLDIYGHIIGMFELNNLDMFVASPVQDYCNYIDDLPLGEKERVEKITRPFLDEFNDNYSSCQGTAFYPLQSCINHSCYPNAKAFKREQDRDGQAVILATRAIAEGEEITISYIDEELPYDERQALLLDYGFTCRCSKCLEEDTQLDY